MLPDCPSLGNKFRADENYSFGSYFVFCVDYYSIFPCYTALYSDSTQMLGDLTAQDGDKSLLFRIKYSVYLQLFMIYQLGILSY